MNIKITIKVFFNSKLNGESQDIWKRKNYVDIGENYYFRTEYILSGEGFIY